MTASLVRSGLMVTLLSSALPLIAACTAALSQPASEDARRWVRPATLAYHSHWFLLGGLRGSYRMFGKQTELAAQLSQSVLTGCAIQAPKCETSLGLAIGARQYFTNTPFTGYAGLNLHYWFDGIRFKDEPGYATELALGIQHQFSGGFVLGLGYSYFFFDDDRPDFNVSTQGWLCSELGFSF